jgi:hypothetical protein
MCTDNCPPGYEDVVGICYTNCNSDQTGVGPTCFNKYCPTGTTEKTAGMCTDNCPPGYEDVVGICYTNCNSDQTGVGPTCFNKYCPTGTTEKTAGMCTDVCKDGYSWDQSACYKNCNDGYYRSSLGFCQEGCKDINYSGLSAPTKQISSGICSAYDFSCPSSYDRWGVGTSTPTCFRPFASRARTLSCPGGYTKVGLFCEKAQYNIGSGTDKECQRTQNGYCHATLPWKCGGGVREEVDLMCYNPCQPAFNSGITCPDDAANINGYCRRPLCPYTSTNGAGGICVR